MRFVLLLLSLATVPAASAQPLPGRGLTRIDRGVVMPSLTGGAAGYLGGGAAGYLAVSTRADGTVELDRTSVYGFAGGAALGAGLGVPLGRLVFGEPTGSVWRSLGGALLGQAAAIGVSLAVEQVSDGGKALGMFVVVSPILSIGGATVGADW